MGRHTAGDGVDVHPIVEAALRRRPASGEPAAPRHCQDTRRLTAAGGQEGDLGWPGEPHTGTGVGWPVDLAPETAPAADQPAAVTLVSNETAEAPVRRRLRWRWIFGGSAAERHDVPHGSSIA